MVQNKKKTVGSRITIGRKRDSFLAANMDGFSYKCKNNSEKEPYMNSRESFVRSISRY